MDRNQDYDVQNTAPNTADVNTLFPASPPKLYGHTPAADFGPNKLRLIRNEMIRGDQAADPPRKPWSRKL
jgi:hypothetical protein